ncbi:MAG: Molybdenum cofactor guanylyltransferase [Firmicutes bacterium]|nr:Molybdenum cofactor guanylyltransferase [candidate division NPL-UPA2 bacterium]MBT9153912.1 Molybdenum cofactor guanylyltransferase [candidate division NPL-UPA2 bacterium]
MHAIILAGASGQDDFARRHGTSNKALIPIGSKPMFAHVLGALLDSTLIQTIVAVGPVADLVRFTEPRVTFIEDSGDMVSNCLTAVRALPGSERVVVVTADIPMLTPRVLESYLASIADKEGDFFYPIISKETNERQYPGVKRTYATLREGTFTGGNLSVINVAVAERIGSRMREFVALRKSVLGLGSLIGLKFLFKLLAGQLSIAEVEQRMSDLMGCKCVAVVCPYPEIGTDIDKDSDLDIARRILAGA